MPREIGNPFLAPLASVVMGLSDKSQVLCGKRLVRCWQAAKVPCSGRVRPVYFAAEFGHPTFCN